MISRSKAVFIIYKLYSFTFNILQMLGTINGRAPILSIFLGHQCFAHHYGCKVSKAREPLHGRIRRLRHTGDPIFNGLPNDFTVTRYHSLIAQRPVRNNLRVIAKDDAGTIKRHNAVPPVSQHGDSGAEWFGHGCAGVYSD